MDKDKANRIYRWMRIATELKMEGLPVDAELKVLFKKVLQLRKEGYQFPEIEETALLLGLKEEDLECMIL